MTEHNDKRDFVSIRENREAWSDKFIYEGKFVLIGIAFATFICWL